MAAVFDSSFAAGLAVFDSSFADAELPITLREDYERSSVNLAGSSVSGAGDAAVITIKPRVQETEAVPTNPRWLEPSIRVDNVAGIRPSFKIIDYAATADANKYHGAPWQSTRRPMFSYDRQTWHYFDTQTVASSEIQFRHDTPFVGNTVYISRERQISVTQMGQWLEGIATAHPTKITPSPSAAAFTPTLTSWPAQQFIAGEYATQIDELGRTIPQTPFYAFEINDTALGGAKRLATMTAGVHAGEDHGDWAFQRAVEYLLSDAPAAISLRTHYRLLIYPCINAPGRAGGGWRGSFTQGTGGADDANRNFTAINGLEIVSLPRSVITADRAGVVPDWHIDWHGAYDNNYGLFVNHAIDTTFRTRAASEFGAAVDDMGALTSDSVAKYFKDSVGCVMSITLEHGAKVPQSDAALVAWGGAVVRTLESMRADGLFYEAAELSASAGLTAGGSATLSASLALSAVGLVVSGGDAPIRAAVPLSAIGYAIAGGNAVLDGSSAGDLQAIGGAQAGGSANIVANVRISAEGLMQAAGAAGLTVAVLQAAAGGAQAGGDVVLSLEVQLAASGGMQTGGVAALDAGEPGSISAIGGAQAGGSAAITATVPLTAAGILQAVAAGYLVAQVDLSAVGGAAPGGAAYLSDAAALVLIESRRWVVEAAGRRWVVTA